MEQGNGLLAGRVVLVTGGARGIGADICRVLAREGAQVALNYSTSEAAARAVQQEVGASSVECFQADVRDLAQVKSMTDSVVDRFGGLDGVVNNAIAGLQMGALSEVSDADFQEAFAFGCQAVVNTTRCALPHFTQRKGGRIVNIVTELWDMAPADWSVYLAGKGAMVGVSRSLAAELGPQNVTVNMVAPGWMVTEKVDPSSEGSRNFAATLPLKRHGSGREIGNACVYFLSSLASYVTGAYLPVTGGRITQMG